MNKKNKTLILILVITLLIVAIGATFAYFQAQIGSGASANVTVTTKTTDVLTFSKGNDISITATQANFYNGAGNLNGSTTATASLRANNDTNSATQTYNVYFNITGNDFEYTTSPTNTPELLLTITDPSGNPVTTLTGLTYTTVGSVSGFDITTKSGLIQIASNYTITSSSGTTATNQTWNITVTLVNLNSDQDANTDKTFTAQAIIQKEVFSPIKINGHPMRLIPNDITCNDNYDSDEYDMMTETVSSDSADVHLVYNNYDDYCEYDETEDQMICSEGYLSIDIFSNWTLETDSETGDLRLVTDTPALVWENHCGSSEAENPQSCNAPTVEINGVEYDLNDQDDQSAILIYFYNYLDSFDDNAVQCLIGEYDP